MGKWVEGKLLFLQLIKKKIIKVNMMGTFWIEDVI